jgi:hypothetical protein
MHAIFFVHTQQFSALRALPLFLFARGERTQPDLFD